MKHVPFHSIDGHHKAPKDRLYVITSYFNPMRYQSRKKLYVNFVEHMRDCGADLYTVEVAFGDREFEVTESSNPKHLQLRSEHVLWLKENALNLMVSRLPQEAEYIAWIDGDVEFVNGGQNHHRNWADEVVQALQHNNIIQPFSKAIDLGPSGESMAVYNSFCYSYVKGLPQWNPEQYYGSSSGAYWHTGFAWAARKEAIWGYSGLGKYGCGGLLDFAVLGSGDHHMAWGLIGKANMTVPGGVSNHYKYMVLQWQERAKLSVRADIGYIPGTLLHYWHGKKADRRYQSRWKILAKTQFDPTLDLMRDFQGVYQLPDMMDDRSILLRDEIRKYFTQRNEDSIDE